jgi:co-chaperonin GroES (HSP10)
MQEKVKDSTYTQLRTDPEMQTGRNVAISKKNNGEKGESEEKTAKVCVESDRERMVRTIVEKVVGRDYKQSGLLIEEPGKPIYASSPSKRTAEEQTEQKLVANDNKRVKWFSGRVYAIHAKKKNERKNIALLSKKERERTLLEKNNAGKARDCDVPERVRLLEGCV